MSKVALYFRRWKNYTRQKNVGEDWAFATKLADLSENFDDENSHTDFEIFQVKFLGSTTVNAAKSEETTANAIKNIISTAKASNKKLQRLKLSICPRGIETFDAQTGETLHRVSIYKISYCSADAAHSNVFAFIAGAQPKCTRNDMDSDDDNEDNDNGSASDELICYAFLCAKRKIAHNLTITVAKNFERAYELWKKSEQREREQCELDRLNGNTLQIKSNQHSNQVNRIQNDNRKNLLIDFHSDAATTAMAATNHTINERQQQMLHQTNWVSFDDEPLMNNNINDMQPMMSGKVFQNNLWDMNVNIMYT